MNFTLVRNFVTAALLALVISVPSVAQEATLRIVYSDGQRQETRLTDPSQLDPVIRTFLEGQRDGAVTTTSRTESGEEETIFWLKRVGEKVSFSEDETEWISLEDALSRFRGANAHTHLTVCQRHLEHLSEALDRWAKDHEGRLPTRLVDLVPTYLVALPNCPTATDVSYSYKVSDSKRYLIVCSGNHEDAGMPLTFPAYDGVKGLIFP